MKLTILTLVAAISTIGTVFADSENERLRALIKEQEGQIEQLELKISRLTDSPIRDKEVNSLLPPKPSPGSSSNSSPRLNNGIYTVVSGDSLERIARHNQVSQAELCKHNNIQRNAIIYPGQKIRIPERSQAASSSSTSLKEESGNDLEHSTSKTFVHRIGKGDNFYRLSIKYGISVDQLVAANPKVNYRALNTGQKIQIPGQSSMASNQSSNRKKAPAVAQQKKKEARAPETPVKVTEQITYQQFAGNYNTTTKRLDELNGLSLDPETVLAEGSELYIPR